MARSGENKKPFCNKKLVVQGPSRMPVPTEYAVIFHGKRLIFCTIIVCFRGVEDVAPYKSCFESLAQAFLHFQKNLDV